MTICERCGVWLTQSWRVTIRKTDPYAELPSMLSKEVCRRCAEHLKDYFDEQLPMNIDIRIIATTRLEVEKVEALIRDLEKLAQQNPEIKLKVTRSS